MNIKNQIIKGIFAIALAFTAFSCSSDDTNKEIAKLPTIAETLTADAANYSVLVNALKVLNITNFSSGGSYTLFAPTNASFAGYTSANFLTGITDAVLVDANGVPLVTLTTAQKNELRALIQNHILGVGTKANDLLTAGYSKTFTPGVGSTTFLSMFVNQVGSDVLINGGSTNGGAKVTTADIDASNGIVHKVDNIIKLPKIVNHAIANPAFSTLVAILTSTATGTYGDQSAVLTSLNGTGPFTVFAPLDSAFATATATGGFVTGANASAANISKILKYHVSSTGNLTSVSATSWSSSSATTDVIITTLQTPQTFKIEKLTVKLTEIPVQTGVPASLLKVVNVQATNGVVHAIDRVLQPVL